MIYLLENPVNSGVLYSFSFIRDWGVSSELVENFVEGAI